MKVGDYVRTKKRGFQYPQIAKINFLEKDNGYKNQYYITLDHNLIPDYNFNIYEEDVDKSSSNIIDLVQEGDVIINQIGEIIVLNSSNIDELKDYWNICEKPIKSIVTKEMFESMEYEVK